MTRNLKFGISPAFIPRSFHPRSGIFFLAAVFLILGFPLRSFSAAPNRIPAVNGCTFWALGVDYAWNNWGTDFSTGYNQATMQADFDAMYTAGIRSVRWWVFTDFDSSPLWSGTGKGSTCTGLPANWVANMTSAANYAASKGMKIYFTLSSFDMAYTGRAWCHDDVITSTAIRASFLNNAITPIASALANNTGVMGWDIVNEPEWMVQASDNGGANTALDQMSLVNVQSYVHDMAATLHLYVKQPVSVGSACMKWCGKDYAFWAGQGLDFFDFHYYDWMTTWYNPAAIAVSTLNFNADTGKPVIVGESMGNPVTEYSGPGSPGFTHQQMATALYNNGYAGYMPWAWHGDDNISANTNLIDPSFANFTSAVGLQFLVCPVGTPTFTPTATMTSTPTGTPTKTFTLTATKTPTPSTTATSTSTSTATHTTTSTSTQTTVITPTATASSTTTSTKTNTQTPTATQTASMTNTTTGTSTKTSTPTATMTPTLGTTATPTSTSTATNTPTSTSSQTPIITATDTATSTTTSTKTNTLTQTPTPTQTASMTSTATPTATPSASPTATATSQFSATNTLSPTATLTFTPTDSMTLTASLTASASPTPTKTSTSTATLTNTLTATSTLTGTPTATPQFSPTNTLSFTPSPTSTTTLTSTFTGTSTDTPILTSTPSFTASPTTTDTPTLSFTPSMTNTGTFTTTPTLSPTATLSPTQTASPTTTPTPAPTPLVGKVGIYPNPVTGPTVQILPPFYFGLSNVRVEVYTLAFRKVQDKTYPSLPSGTAVTLSLTDKSGHPMANGIYYVEVTTVNGRSIGKLLILR